MRVVESDMTVLTDSQQANVNRRLQKKSSIAPTFLGGVGGVTSDVVDSARMNEIDEAGLDPQPK